MPNTHTSLTDLFEDIADAIRGKTGSSASIVADNFPTEISNIPSGGGGGATWDQVCEKTYSGAVTASTASTVVEYAFKGAGITSFNGASVTSIQGWAFQDCSSLTSVSVPLCQEISNTVFMGTSLSQANFPSLIQFTGGYCFSGITTLTSVSMPELINQNKYGNGGTRQFSGCTSLVSVYMPKIKYMTQWNNDDCYMFYGCTSLTTVDVTAVQDVGTYAFYGCTALEQLNLPNAKHIYASAFQGSGLKVLTVGTNESASMCTLSGAGQFLNTPIGNLDADAHIYVAASLVSTYQADSKWGTYSSIISAIPTP